MNKKIELPLPKRKEKKTLCQAMVGADLWNVANNLRKARGYTWSEILEFGLSQFIKECQRKTEGSADR